MLSPQCRVFQFHKGAIRTLLKHTIKTVLSDFNSIKVRLELPAVRVPKDADLFQFHKGAIRTRCRRPTSEGL